MLLNHHITCCWVPGKVDKPQSTTRDFRADEERCIIRRLRDTTNPVAQGSLNESSATIAVTILNKIMNV